MDFIKKHFPFILANAGIFLFLVLGYYYFQPKTGVEPVRVERHEATKETAKPESVIPSAKTVAVPYTVQAPLTNWNVHEESCEEAAVLMMHYYFDGSNLVTIPAKTANQELIDMKKWQVAHYGKESDLTLSSLGDFAFDYYGYGYKVQKNVTADDIKRQIAQGLPVLVPVITHGLENPHYGPNPTYHILLIKGYDASGVITNDAGIREGRNRQYNWNILWQAIDAQKAKMHQGRDMLILTK